MNKTWKIGVAFIRGLNMYGHGRVTQSEMKKICRQLENGQLNIVSIIKPDTILFRKKGMHYAAVGQKLERILTSHFGKPFYVTTRSMRTLQSIFEKYQKEEFSLQP
jgi:uncharacterized protein (DUF1697 family)